MYREARDELRETITDYFESFRARDEEMKKLIGTVQNGKEWTEQDYKQWRLNQIARGKRFENLRDKIAERMTRANETAIAYVNDDTPSIYSLNRNYAAYTIEQVAGDVGFTMWDEQTVKRLIVEDPDLMPYYPSEKAVKRGIDLAWGKKQITSTVTSGILQGKSINGLSNDLQKRIPEMNRTSAIRAARTAVTGAQNAGRMDSYHAAEKMGIKLKKTWLATLDGRTRHSHALLDGKTVDIDKPFVSEIGSEMMFPGDNKGAKAADLYNCRCTMIADVAGVDTSDAQRWARNPETGRGGTIKNTRYSEWEKASVEKSGGVATETYMLPVNAGKEEIEALKKTMSEDLARQLVGAQKGFSYRAYAKEDGMSSWGHAMFADSTDMLDVYGGSDPKWFSVSEKQLTDINILKKDILKARRETVMAGGLEDYDALDDDEFFAMFDPQDIVMSADAYDNDELTAWLYQKVLEPKGIPGIKTEDGAIVYDNSIMVRNLPMEVLTNGETEAEKVEEIVEAAAEAKESVEMAEYLAFKAKMIEKYGVDSMYGDMTDQEYDMIERLERIAYTGK